MFSSVRVRLTFWYVLACGLLLVGFSLFIYVVLSKSLYERLDHSLSNATQTAAGAFQTEVDENGGNVEAGAQEALSELRLPDVYIAIYRGEQLLATDYPEGQSPALPENSAALIRAGNQVAFTTVAGFGKEGARVAIATVQLAAKDYFVVVTGPLHDLVEQLGAIRRTFYFGLPATLLVAGLGGFLLARQSLAPVVAMSDQAARIGAKNLHERLRVNNENDELGHLAGVLNQLLSRLDRSFENMREFMADASHELRTPLSIIRGEADVALSQDRDSTAYKEALAIIQDEARRLSRLVDDLLALARADAGQRPLQIGEFYLNDLVDECCRAAQVLAAQKGLTLALASSPDISFRGDQDLLRRMILNLLDNAVKYTPAGGTISVALIADAARVKIVVADTGIGVPAEAAAQIFERFYRVRKARTRADGGSGLGLAIARWAAEAHHGSIALASQPRQGSTFTVTLPR